jgi:hypothetical protein
MKKISIAAIIAGALIYFLVAMTLELPLTLYVKDVLLERGIDKRLLGPVIQGEILMTPLLFAIRFLSGAFATVIGGYFAARIARSNLLINATFSTLIRFLIGLYSVENIFNSLPTFLLILSDLLSPVLGFLGGYLRLLECKKKACAQNLSLSN